MEVAIYVLRPGLEGSNTMIALLVAYRMKDTLVNLKQKKECAGNWYFNFIPYKMEYVTLFFTILSFSLRQLNLVNNGY